MSFIIPASAKTWVDVNIHSHFPIQNIPFGMAIVDDEQRLVSRLGDYLIDILALADAELIDGDEDQYFDIESVVSDEGPIALSNLRKSLYNVFRLDNPKLRDDRGLRESVLLSVKDYWMAVPMQIDSFVDFYSGINHASNVGKMFRPDQAPLLPNYRELPIGYNGRASSVILSGEPIFRPKGQTKGPNDERPSFGPTKELDFELEMGFFTGAFTEMGDSIAIDEAEDAMLGLVLVNDWSARDVQRFEYVPLGPFLAKSFATSVSPWIVTMDALEPFRVAGRKQEPEPLEHLRQSKAGLFDIVLEVSLKTQQMEKAQVISRTNYKELYWSAAQQLAHQSSNGTPVEVGDLYASGTISGETPDSLGSMLELTWKGDRPLKMEDTGEERRFIEDGDVVTFTGYCEGNGYRVGFGEVFAEILPAR